MQRYLEPELMDNLDQVLAFHKGSKDYGIQGFLSLYEKHINIAAGKVVDLGCGTGSYLFALEEKYPKLSITGYDGSSIMIHVGQGVADCKSSGVRLRHQDFENVNDTADIVISTNTLHHLHNTDVFWNCIKRISNRVFIMDLIRPANDEIAKTIVETLAGNDSKEFKTDYYNSLLAAFSVDELLKQIEGTNLKLEVEGTPDFLQVAVIHGTIL
jgi:ubiquinone/menaquinone biosynthesis C-methylase UbiE